MGATYHFTTIELEAGMKLMLPQGELDKQLRSPLEKPQAEKVLEHLQDYEPPGSDNWKTRKRRNQDRLTSGDPFQLAEMLKGLHSLAEKRRLASSDQLHLHKVTELLSQELAYALSREPEWVSERLEEICTATVQAA